MAPRTNGDLAQQWLTEASQRDDPEVARDAVAIALVYAVLAVGDGLYDLVMRPVTVGTPGMP